MMEQHTPEPWEIRTYIDRFWSRVDVSGDNDCWEWARGTTRDGYGVFHFGNSSIRAHRFSYQQSNGRITEHECVLHSCDNPRCVNPKHLWVGSRAENNADKEAKKRGIHPVQLSGELNTNAVLTTPEVVAARVMHRKGLSQARIAKLLGVSTASVCMILSGERRAEETEQRVSACVNACAGFSNDELEGANLHKDSIDAQNEIDELRADLATAEQDSRQKQARIDRLERERDEMLSAFNKFMDSHEECTDFDGFTAQIVSVDDYHEAQEYISRMVGGAE